ncbi:MAG: sugar phosphate nucleotidyltransferase [Solirubrobacteraceae bacterium]
MAIDGIGTGVILCGGRGTRLQEHSRSLPKPLVEIGGRPIVWHVLQIYAAQGVRRFLLCTGYQGEAIERFVASTDWNGLCIECVPTGDDTPTGGRVRRVADRVGDRSFWLTYADGLADIDLADVAAHHRAHGGLATITVVRPELPFGVAELGPQGRVVGFHEKPRSEHWINGGFFCLEPGVFDYVTESSVLEREPLEGLAGDGELGAYRHTGFWGCMDTYKDAARLEDLWRGGRAPWKVW